MIGGVSRALAGAAIRAPKRIVLNWPGLAAVPSGVTVDLGTLAISAGKLKAATMGDALNNLVTNGESWTGGPPPTGWSPVRCAATRVDSIAEGIGASGGADDWVLKLAASDTSPFASQNITAGIIGAYYAARMRGYCPSSNTTERGWRLVFIGAAAVISAEDVWQDIVVAASLAAATTNAIYPHGIGSVAGDVVYADKVVAYRQNAMWHVQAAPTFRAVWFPTMPAALATPIGCAFRKVDALNYWEVRLTPGAPGSVALWEVVAGVETQRATTNVTLAASTEYRVDIRVAGASVQVYVNGVLAINYTAMATHLTASNVGGILYDTVARSRLLMVEV